jgi:hypothetical protein
MVADGAAQHGIAGLERVQHRALRDRGFDFESYLGADLGQGAEMEGEDYADHVDLFCFSAFLRFDFGLGASGTSVSGSMLEEFRDDENRPIPYVAKVPGVEIHLFHRVSRNPLDPKSAFEVPSRKRIAVS